MIALHSSMPVCKAGGEIITSLKVDIKLSYYQPIENVCCGLTKMQKNAWQS